jgi:hypothetical protein
MDWTRGWRSSGRREVAGKEAGMVEGVEERLEEEVEEVRAEGAALQHAAHGQDDPAQRRWWRVASVVPCRSQSNTKEQRGYNLEPNAFDFDIECSEVVKRQENKIPL